MCNSVSIYEILKDKSDKDVQDLYPEKYKILLGARKKT